MKKIAAILLGLPWFIYGAVFDHSHFQAQLNELSRQTKYKNVRLGIAIRPLAGDESTFLLNDTEAFMPASTLKLILSAAALHFYHPDSCFRVPIYRDGALQDGILTGNMYLKGIGAPNILLDSLRQTIKRLKLMGIKVINGNIVYDDQAFTAQEPRFPPNARDRWMPGGALVLNSNRIELRVQARSPQLQLEAYPNTAYARITTDFKYLNSDQPSSPDMRYHIEPDGDRFTLKGTVSRWTERTNYLALGATRPGLLFATVFKEELEKNAIIVKGNIHAGSCPEGLTIVDHILSPPLKTMLLEMNSASDNIIAENLFRKLGLDQYGVPSDEKKGGQAMKQFVKTILPAPDFVCADGSGLSPDSRISPATFIHLLGHFYKNSPRLLSILPIEGPERNNLKVIGKSGTLSARGLNALAGYILENQSETAFAFVIFCHREPNPTKLWSGTLTHPIVELILENIHY